jgi:hypothetical protein
MLAEDAAYTEINISILQVAVPGARGNNHVHAAGHCSLEGPAL